MDLVQNDSSPLGPRIGIASLEAWYQEYNSAPDDDTTPESDVIQAIEVDVLDHGEVKRRVKHLIPSTNIRQQPGLGCKFCAFLLSRMAVEGLLDPFRRIEARLRRLGNTATASLTIQSWGVARNPQLLWLNLPGKAAHHCNSKGALAKFESHYLSPKDKLWQTQIQRLDLAKTWLNECHRSHLKCRSMKQHELPTRLLEISGNTIKLVSTATLQDSAQYATLSYCWGVKKFSALTSDKVDSFQRGIVLEDLPQTLQDAIIVARRLSIEYLWIDALCIIQNQDDKKDWRREVSHMKSVYGGASIGLAASSATNAYEGCLSKQPYYSAASARAQSVYRESSTDTPLAKRAWALQEKLLPPRTIRFGDTGLFWECRSMIRSEYLPDGFPGKLGSHDLRPEDKAWSWPDIVTHYSAAQLTYGSDKLPALSGIASRQHEITHDDYLAGLWRQALTSQLGWGIWEPQQRRDRPDLGIPSWSWASVEGQTWYWPWNNNNEMLKEHAFVIDAWTKLAGTDLFGAVIDGEISIRCSSLVGGHFRQSPAPIRGNRRATTTETVLAETTDISFPIILDCLDDASTLDNDVVYLVTIVHGRTGSRFKFKSDSADLIESAKPAAEDTEWREELTCHGIVLKEHNKLQDCFRRIGSFDFTHTPIRVDKANSCEQGNCYYHKFLPILEKGGTSPAASENINVSTDQAHKAAPYIVKIR
ncbi:putative Heterokaryon incompatibility protein-domain-containing protein [Seiridium unicorne]|uniref:Heterokaryon incompatibility protein-domain-containing protein n=1 Tax=Seiridium unicorne TaxID=138068 RepID=A0ABR2VAK9_9PEZI